MKVFLDTNVVIDFCAKRNPFFDDAALIMDMAYRNEVSIVLSSLTVVNVAYILRKVFPIKDIKEKLGELLKICRVSPVDSEIIEKAIAWEAHDFEDCIQYLSAVSYGCDLIVTRDEDGFGEFPMPIYTPDNYIRNCKIG